YLLTKFTTPEEIFGPLSIKELKEDRFYRKTEGYLPAVQIGFLDEIFKTNSSILNTLLTIMNEKVFHNGSKKENINLISLIGASNEDPSNDLELNALYDRFLIRKVVEYIQDDELNKFFDISSEKFKLNENLRITLKEIQEIEENLNKVTIPSDIRDIIIKIKLDLKDVFKNNNQEDISDRKFIKILKLLKISAYTNERNQVDISDVLLLKNCLWNNPENQKIVSDTIINNIKDGYKLIEISNEDKVFGINNDRTLNKFDFKGMGTESNPFIIEDENDLIHIGTTDYLDKGYYFEQSKDIKIASHWHSIGSEEKPFKGNYNGNNKSITRLNNALFFKIDDSEIKNLILNEVDINSTLEKVGALCNIGVNSSVEQCNISGKLQNKASKNSYVGGIIGSSETVNIKNCNTEVIIFSESWDYSYVGGIIGFAKIGVIENCLSKNSSIDLSSKYNGYAGGVVGFSSDILVKNIMVEKNKISSSASYSDNTSYSGGVIGFAKDTNIKNIIVKENFITSFNENRYNSKVSSGVSGYISGGCTEYCTIISSSIYASSPYVIANSYNCNLNKNYYNDNNTLGHYDRNNNSTPYCIETLSNDENGINGKSLDPSHFNEKFYKRLRWDFENIWIWDENNNTPILRQINNISENVIEKISMGKNELSNILNNNIWI
ncbi:AAA family ATPase, partial [Cetobacterium sp.]|uniref:AAA family ATPase n=1 Tax=Cetobacterium sp. TaxID=2071632 RepID=UPI002FC6010E